jgi:hypothetical protein
MPLTDRASQAATARNDVTIPGAGTFQQCTLAVHVPEPPLVVSGGRGRSG